MEQVIQERKISSTYERVATGGLLSAAVCVAGAVWYFDPVTAGFFPSCPLYSMTGIFCPGCGMTRAFHALFQGDVITALDFNIMTPAYVFIFGYVFISTLMIVVRGYGLTYKIFQPWWMYSLVVLAMIFGIVRNIPSYPFNILAP